MYCTVVLYRYFVQKALLESKEKKRKRKDGEKEKGVDEDDDSSSDIRAGSVKMDFAWYGIWCLIAGVALIVKPPPLSYVFPMIH